MYCCNRCHRPFLTIAEKSRHETLCNKPPLSEERVWHIAKALLSPRRIQGTGYASYE